MVMMRVHAIVITNDTAHKCLEPIVVVVAAVEKMTATATYSFSSSSNPCSALIRAVQRRSCIIWSPRVRSDVLAGSEQALCRCGWSG